MSGGRRTICGSWLLAQEIFLETIWTSPSAHFRLIHRIMCSMQHRIIIPLLQDLVWHWSRRWGHGVAANLRPRLVNILFALSWNIIQWAIKDPHPLTIDQKPLGPDWPEWLDWCSNVVAGTNHLNGATLLFHEESYCLCWNPAVAALHTED